MPRPRSNLGSRLRALRQTAQLSDRRFGLEVEFQTGSHNLAYYADAIRDGLCAAGDKRTGEDAARFYEHSRKVHARDSYFHSDGTGWDVKVDGSCGYELASPVLTAKDWPVVEVVMEALQRAGARVNRQCGYHVHHEARDLRQSHIRNLIRLWGAFDAPMHNALAPSRRENSYAERGIGVRNSGIDVRFDSQTGRYIPTPDADARNLSRVIRRYGRYQSLNLVNWAVQGRIEFRAHHGTLNATKMRAWLAMTQRFVDTAAAGRPQRIIAAAAVSPLATLERTAHVLGRPLYRVLLQWLQQRNPQYLSTLALPVAA